jgi:hypothetical protein
MGWCAIRCSGAVLVCDDAVLQAVVKFGAAVYGKARATGSVDGCNQIDSGLFHQSDSSKEALQAQ